jgi:hypothetical protein
MTHGSRAVSDIAMMKMWAHVYTEIFITLWKRKKYAAPIGKNVNIKIGYTSILRSKDISYNKNGYKTCDVRILFMF